MHGVDTCSYCYDMICSMYMGSCLCLCQPTCYISSKQHNNIIYIYNSILLLILNLLAMENTCSTCNMEYDIDITFNEETNSHDTIKKCICDYMNMFYEHDSQMEKEYELPF